MRDTQKRLLVAAAKSSGLEECLAEYIQVRTSPLQQMIVILKMFILLFCLNGRPCRLPEAKMLPGYHRPSATSRLF